MTWREDAACLGSTETMYPEKPGHAVDYGPARALCLACPVRVPCLLHALDEDERLGMWGGADPDERGRMQVAIKRARRRAA